MFFLQRIQQHQQCLFRGKGLNNLFNIRKNTIVKNETYKTLSIALEPVDLIILLGKFKIICVKVTITTKNVASIVFNLSVFKRISPFNVNLKLHYLLISPFQTNLILSLRSFCSKPFISVFSFPSRFKKIFALTFYIDWSIRCKVRHSK